jgi:hypothetical protein
MSRNIESNAHLRAFGKSELHLYGRTRPAKGNI